MSTKKSGVLIVRESHAAQCGLQLKLRRRIVLAGGGNWILRDAQPGKVGIAPIRYEFQYVPRFELYPSVGQLTCTLKQGACEVRRVHTQFPPAGGGADTVVIELVISTEAGVSGPP